jgi:NAD(P)-dependent dehydrogenase (short-subunit alcohol dehydrogenase family)
MEDRFNNRVALVTGGGGGLGRAIALALARNGAKVVVADVTQAGEETVQLVIDAGGEARFVVADVTDPVAVERMINEVVSAYGHLDFAVNNAGIDGPRALTAEYPEEDWHKVININLTGVWLCMKYEIRQMLTQGGGIIVNIASVAGLVGFSSYGAYAASKHGVIGLTKTAALEYARKGIRINAVCPAFTRTAMVERIFEQKPELEERLVKAIPIGRLGTPEEIADAVIYLCGDTSAFMTGHALVLDGGLTAQ